MAIQPIFGSVLPFVPISETSLQTPILRWYSDTVIPAFVGGSVRVHDKTWVLIFPEFHCSNLSPSWSSSVLKFSGLEMMVPTNRLTLSGNMKSGKPSFTVISPSHISYISVYPSLNSQEMMAIWTKKHHIVQGEELSTSEQASLDKSQVTSFAQHGTRDLQPVHLGTSRNLMKLETQRF